MKFSISEISEIIELAWDDQTDFSHITKIYNIDEGEVKKIMKKNIKSKSYTIWRKRIAQRSDQRIKKKQEDIETVNYPLLEQLDVETVDVDLYQVESAEMDEMWSFVARKKQQRWLWHAIDHASGVVLAYVLAPHQDQALVKLVNLLKPFGIKRFFTDAWGAYERILDPDTHLIGKKNTQRIERKHLTLRTRIKRLARKTICFSKSILMHDIVIGLFINRYEFSIQSHHAFQQI